MSGGLVVDAFGGPGGVAEGLRDIGLHEIGFEVDPWACATRAAAGHRTIRADVRRVPLDHLTGRVGGLWLSPPCQAFSAAGRGEARRAIEQLRRCIVTGDWIGRGLPGATILEVGRWAETLRPGWVACEQVPPALPLWRAYAARWRAMGWSVWCGLLCAADFGVPQTRVRAILMAHPDGRPVVPPEPTHAEGGTSTLFGTRALWVSMRDAIGWGTDLPARTVCGARAPRWLYADPGGSHGRVVLDRRTNSKTSGGVLVATAPVPVDRPAPTLTATAGAKSQWIWRTVEGDETERFTLAEALAIQSFRPGYPVQGRKSQQFEQIGNAVPPLLAAAIVRAVTR